MPESKTILILGGGVGGLVTALSLRRSLPRTHRIVLVNREANYLFQPSLLWLMTGARRPEQITRPLGLLKRKGIEVVRGAVESIDPRQRRVQGQSWQADHLVIALGAELALEAIPGLDDGGARSTPWMEPAV